MQEVAAVLLAAMSLINVLPVTEAFTLVYPRLLEERGHDGALVLHVTDELILNLQKSSIAAPLLRVVRYENGKHITSLHKGEEFDGSLYHSKDKFASVHVSRSEDGIEVEGIIGPYKRIEPMPTMARTTDGRIAHIVHNIDAGGTTNRGSFDNELAPRNDNSATSTGTPQNVPETVEVELFVMVDTFHSRHFHERKKLIAYVCIMMNTVNLYLAETKQPTIRLLLTGVETREDEPYLKSKAESISAEETIQELNNYATANKDTHGNPDIVYLLSGRDLYGQRYGRADRGLRGLGYNSGLCAYYHVALGEDKAGTYSGADTAAHEIGHLLGATDDGSPPEPHYPGKPDSRRCSGWYGFIMSYIKTGAASYHYSDCSLQQMRYWVSRVGPSCWRVNAKKIYNVTKKYPGMVMTPEVYCQRLFPNEQNVTADPGEWFKATCMVRCLYNPSGEVIHTGHTKYKDVYALEHTPCGEEKACIQGFCTEKPQKKPPESERGQ
ncbi:venom metalloproteinase antarease TserMP_A-like isoform X1 [Dermacentor andersoni]|uniref:venom metalloproteinase antarease TserMP_A-like isoform X1 n=1 Tax=Dermacentor andersoni TaxID=34620 RepID=UPI002416B641|nr:venom metalloproteinase antarease TserMP_A-like isoform X1 [Dermacentor andersoni]